MIVGSNKRTPSNGTAQLPRPKIDFCCNAFCSRVGHEMHMNFIGAQPRSLMAQMRKIEAVGIIHRLADIEGAADAVGTAMHENIVHLRHQRTIDKREDRVKVALTRRAAPIVKRLLDRIFTANQCRLIGRYEGMSLS